MVILFYQSEILNKRDITHRDDTSELVFICKLFTNYLNFSFMSLSQTEDKKYHLDYCNLGICLLFLPFFKIFGKFYKMFICLCSKFTCLTQRNTISSDLNLGETRLDNEICVFKCKADSRQYEYCPGYQDSGIDCIECGVDHYLFQINETNLANFPV